MGDFYAGDRGFAWGSTPGGARSFGLGSSGPPSYRGAAGCDQGGLAFRACSWMARPRLAQYDCLIEQLDWAADRLAGQGVRLATELLEPRGDPWDSPLSSLERVRSKMLAQLDGRVGFQLDVYHLQRTHGDVIPTIAETAEYTTHYQGIADATHAHGARHLRNQPSATSSRPSRRPATRGSTGCEYRPSAPDVDAFAWMDDLGVVKASARWGATHDDWQRARWRAAAPAPSHSLWAPSANLHRYACERGTSTSRRQRLCPAVRPHPPTSSHVAASRPVSSSRGAHPVSLREMCEEFSVSFRLWRGARYWTCSTRASSNDAVAWATSSPACAIAAPRIVVVIIGYSEFPCGGRTAILRGAGRRYCVFDVGARGTAHGAAGEPTP